MEQPMKLNAVNTAEAGTCLLHESEDVTCICMVLKGKAAADSKGTYLPLGAGAFLGVNDLYEGKYLCNYIALEDITYYAFPVRGTHGLNQILAANKDYGGLMLWGYAKYITELYRVYEELVVNGKALNGFVKDLYKRYREIGDEEGVKTRPLKLAEETKSFAPTYIPDERAMKYYKECARVALEKHKAYFADSHAMAHAHIETEAGLINTLLKACREAADYLEDLFFILMNRGEQSLFLYVSALLIEAGQKGKETTELSGILDRITDKINDIEVFFRDRIGRTIYVDRERMEEAYHAVIVGKELAPEAAKTEEQRVEVEGEELNRLLKCLQGSLKQILEFSSWPEEQAEPFAQAVERFVNLSDRMSTVDTVRKLKKDISRMFFDLYQDVFLQAYEKANAPFSDIPLAVELFLDYAFVDERLVTEEQISHLLAFQKQEQTTPCKVYTMREWLTLIYEGKRMPSKSEFDLDYEETLRDMRKRGAISEIDMKVAATDAKSCLEFEIHNMYACNARLVNGQISTFVPILYSEGLSWALPKAYLTKTGVNDIITRLMQNDPTVFHREVMFSDVANHIEREYITKQVFPEIIMLPVNGTNGIMWQDLSGKRRDSEGRFLLPIFFENRPEDSFIKMFGRFRWELCRTIQGTVWNSIQVRSLTSEYCDYLQYYRKNRDLSEEKREKVKLQIQRAKGNSREAFVQDYEQWVKYEASGAVRLNKVAREILATYCPFSKMIRKNLAGQPIFDEATARFERNLNKKLYDLDLHYRNLEKEKIVLAPEMMKTIEYYRNL